MGQAAVDLPDPLETPPHSGAANGAAGTDELLSQLAGEEIDRLLADADVDPEALSGPSSAAPDRAAPPVTASETTFDRGDRPKGPPVVPGLPAEPNADLLPDVPGLEPETARGDADGAASPGPVGANPAARSAAAGASPAAPLIGSNIPAGPETSATEEAALAELFDQLTGGGGGAKQAAHGRAKSVADPLAPNPSGDVPSGTATAQAHTADKLDELPGGGAGLDVFEMTAAERAALEAPLPSADDAIDPQAVPEDAPPDSAPVDQKAPTPEEPPEPAPIFQYERVPLYVWVLELINAPLDSLPDDARDAIGKVAVMTLVNAVAILVYVLFFRH